MVLWEREIVNEEESGGGRENERGRVREGGRDSVIEWVWEEERVYKRECLLAWGEIKRRKCVKIYYKRDRMRLMEKT